MPAGQSEPRDARQSRSEQLQPAVERAGRAGTLVIAAFSHEGERWLPGSLPGALGVCLDWECPGTASASVAATTARPVRVGLPAAIPGVRQRTTSTASASLWRTRRASSPSRSSSSRSARPH